MAALVKQNDKAPAASCVIRELAADNRGGLEKVAALHMELLDYGPMAGLGEWFIRDVCYAAPMEDDLLKVALYEVDGKPAGFVAYTAWSITFHRHALKRHWLRACWVLIASLVRNPSLLGGLLRALRVIASRRSEQKQGSDPSGEVVAIAVRPEYSSAKFVRRTARKVSEELVTHAAAYLQRCGVTDMRMLVDADNKAPLFLYHSLGASFEDYEQGGEPMVQVKFDLAAKPIAGAGRQPSSSARDSR